MTRTEQRLPPYDAIAVACSRLTTQTYSTSFSLGIRTLAPEIRDDIYSIYGFVRVADEIVDSFHDYDRRALLERYKADTFRAIDERISANPILQAFQQTFHRYELERGHVQQFLESMEWDLDRTTYDREGFDRYIVGSAEVVGLMCLKVFLRGNAERCAELEDAAARLGAAFQKVNFLRDLGEDYRELGRTYFPDVDMSNFDDETKRAIEMEIEKDFDAAVQGIRELPRDARFGVYLAYVYYRRLLRRILSLPGEAVMNTRVRVSGIQKFFLTVLAFGRHRLNLV